MGPILASIFVMGLILGGLLIAIFKGSRPPIPVPRHFTPPRRAAIAVAVSIFCVVVIYATPRAVELFEKTYFVPSQPILTASAILGVVVPYFLALYYAYVAARAEQILLRAIGATEVLIFSLVGVIVLLERITGRS